MATKKQTKFKFVVGDYEATSEKESIKIAKNCVDDDFGTQIIYKLIPYAKVEQAEHKVTIL